jgi:hypothetical protein
MGFDLWSALGISPITGLLVAGAGMVLAALLAGRMFLRGRGEARRAGGLDLTGAPRRDSRP